MIVKIIETGWNSTVKHCSVYIDYGDLSDMCIILTRYDTAVVLF